jgi:hypothetical protein
VLLCLAVLEEHEGIVRLSPEHFLEDRKRFVWGIGCCERVFDLERDLIYLYHVKRDPSSG